MSFWNWLTRRRTDRGWPGYIVNGRIRTSTASLVFAFFAIAWLHNTYQPPPIPTAPETAQVVPPGFMPDPEYTWVPPYQRRDATQNHLLDDADDPDDPTESTPTEKITTETTTSETTETTSPTSPTTSGQAPTTLVDPDGPGPLPPTTVTQTETTTPMLPVPNRSGTSTTTTATFAPGTGPVPTTSLPPG